MNDYNILYTTRVPIVKKSVIKIQDRFIYRKPRFSRYKKIDLQDITSGK